MNIVSFLPLAALEAAIDQRVAASIETYPCWLCHRGCDECCRRLARLPELTAAEWERLSEGIIRLPTDVQSDVATEIRSLGERITEADDFIVCPLLNEANGECRVYAYRPMVCRMFGFYVGRDGNRWCNDIQTLYEAEELDEVVFGNYDAAQRDLQRHGGVNKSLYVWFIARESPAA